MSLSSEWLTAAVKEHYKGCSRNFLVQYQVPGSDQPRMWYWVVARSHRTAREKVLENKPILVKLVNKNKHAKNHLVAADIKLFIDGQPVRGR